MAYKEFLTVADTLIAAIVSISYPLAIFRVWDYQRCENQLLLGPIGRSGSFSPCCGAGACCPAAGEAMLACAVGDELGVGVACSGGNIEPDEDVT